MLKDRVNNRPARFLQQGLSLLIREVKVVAIRVKTLTIRVKPHATRVKPLTTRIKLFFNKS